MTHSKPQSSRCDQGEETKRLSIRVVGPDVRGIGGIESVIRAYLTSTYHGADWSHVDTWRRGDKALNRIVLPTRAAITLLIDRLCKRTDLVHAHVSHHGSLLREGGLALWARLIGLPAVLTVHGSVFAHVDESWFYSKWVKLLARRVDGVATLTAEAESVIRDMAPDTYVARIGNPGMPRQSPQIPAPVSRYVFAGEIGVRKGFDVLIEAWRLVMTHRNDLELHVYGVDGQGYTPPATEGVSYHGPVNANIILASLGTPGTVAVLPSRAEALPMFLLEAMASSAPAVASDVGSISDLLEDCGTVVPVGDAKRLASALLAYAENPSLTERHGTSALEKFNRLYSFEAHMVELETFYRTAGVAR